MMPLELVFQVVLICMILLLINVLISVPLSLHLEHYMPMFHLEIILVLWDPAVPLELGLILIAEPVHLRVLATHINMVNSVYMYVLMTILWTMVLNLV